MKDRVGKIINIYTMIVESTSGDRTVEVEATSEAKARDKVWMSLSETARDACESIDCINITKLEPS